MHGDGGGRGLVRLVEALQHGREHGLALAEDPRRPAYVVGVDAADVGDVLGGVGLDDVDRRSSRPSVWAATQSSSTQPLTRSSRVRPFISARLVPTRGREVHAAGALGLHRDQGAAWVDAHDPRRVIAARAVEDACPQDGLGLGHVVAVEEDRVAVLDVGVRARLAVGAEGLLERRGAGGGAQPGVAVHVRRAEPGLADDGEGVVLLEEQLAGGVEAVAQRPLGLEQRLRPLHDAAHGGLPVGLDQPTALAHQRSGQPVAGFAHRVDP